MVMRDKEVPVWSTTKYGHLGTAKDSVGFWLTEPVELIVGG